MASLLTAFFCFSAAPACTADDADKTTDAKSAAWQAKAVDYARIMSRVKWTPVVQGMPKRGGEFEAGKVYTGVPYSSVKAEGRYIGFDIFLPR